ncbi:hypothetical protein CASFOL_016603 [Castilleja foliolosa]|uniref:Uncharacterized protein n=1 Tax=Castilleja foliolosa TaxID=1961234 RepID=A0ABD3DCM0_9LAMI
MMLAEEIVKTVKTVANYMLATCNIKSYPELVCKED